jgi:hypothetical protein
MHAEGLVPFVTQAEDVARKIPQHGVTPDKRGLIAMETARKFASAREEALRLSAEARRLR